MHMTNKFGRSLVITAIGILAILAIPGAADAASKMTGSCLSRPSEKCVLDILVGQGPASVELVEALALAGRAIAAKSAAANLQPETRHMVEAIGIARAGKLARALEVASKIKTEARDYAVGNIALALARRGNLGQALGVANKVSSTINKAGNLWRIARVMAVTGKTDKLGDTIDRAFRADPDIENKVMPVLLALVARGAQSTVADLILRGRGDGKPWGDLIVEDAIDMLIAAGNKGAARNILAGIEKRLEAEKERDRKYRLKLLVRSYAALGDSRTLRALNRRYKNQIDPGFLVIQFARAGDSAFALTALIISSRSARSARSGDRRLYFRAQRVLVARALYASGDRLGGQILAKKIAAGLPSRGSKAWNVGTVYVHLTLLAGTGRVAEALQLVEAKSLKAFSRRQALAWYILPAVAFSGDTAGIVHFLNYLARTKAIGISKQYQFNFFCDAIARTSWADRLDQSRAIAAALLRASLADTQSTDYDHEGVGKCQLSGGDHGGAIETVRAIKDTEDRRTILLEILKYHLRS